MQGRRPLTIAALLTASAFGLAACGSDDSSSTAAAPAATSASDSPTDLAGVCPSTVTIQTDWEPESDHSEAYALLGGTITYDKSKKRVTGDLYASGKPTGVKVEVRAGGPATGFSSPTQQMYTDKDIYLGYVNTDEAVQNSGKFPTVSVMAPREKWAQVLIYDPGTYDFKTIADIGKTNTKVLYFKGNYYMDYLTGAGILKKSQVDSSYDGKPARFVTAGGKIVQQGFITAEPWQYEHTVKQWAKPVATLSIADAGYPNYGETLAIKKANLAKDTPCLKKLIPIIQQAQVDYAKDPTAADAIIVKAVETYNDGWEYPAALAAFAAKAQVDQGIISDGPTPALGDIDATRTQKIVDLTAPIFKKANIQVKDGLTATDLFTNEFIDTSIGLDSSK
ncbi:MAG: hypothetical protein AAGC46_01630 [Solirubrobacteraceae bacterium]|nr:hypothetical protein [Patulibacter sp.]